MSATRSLASYISGIKYDDLPPLVVEKAKLAIIDALGNCIGGYPISGSEIFLEMAKDFGGGKQEATLIGDGTRVSVPMAAFGNGALSTALDYVDYHRNDSGRCPIWPGALDVPASLAAGESRGISGKELIASVVAGFECAARVIHSMDQTMEQAQKITGRTVPVFAATGGAGRALGLDEDQMLSAIGMTGIYTPVPASYKWMGDEGLTPRKDIKQGWAWLCMTGAFAAVSAKWGLKMLQENNILDGERGLWSMLGMDIHREEALTEGFGELYHIEQFASKLYPGCYVTHAAMVGAKGLVEDNNIPISDVDKIEVITQRAMGIGFDDLDFRTVTDRQFNIPYQVSAALVGGERGPNWYSDKVAKSPELADMLKRVTMSHDKETDDAFWERNLCMCKVAVHTRSGERYTRSVEQAGLVRSADEVRNKFMTTTTQVIDRGQIDKILNTIDSLESVGNVSELVDLLRVPAPRGG